MATTAAQPPVELGVPFLDLRPSHEPLKAALLAEIADLIDNGAFTNGPQVREFEAAFASSCMTNHCVGVASGLDGLRLALQAAGIAPGDEVIVPANTFVATAEAVSQVGAVPVLADVSNADYNVDPAAVEAALTRRTKCLLPVHLYGQLADMRPLDELAARYGLQVIEDACQAHGAIRDGRLAGTSGTAGVFSFYPGKNLGAFGDAGGVVTGSSELADRLRSLREHGQTAKYRHDSIGWTSRLDTVQAIALLAKLPHLPRWNEERRAAAAYYLERLDGVGDLILPPIAQGSEPVWHLFVIRTAAPAALATFLREHNIGTGRHYPEPIHLTNAYASLGYRKGAFPVAEQLAVECLSLPIFPGVTEDQLACVCARVEAYFARG